MSEISDKAAAVLAEDPTMQGAVRALQVLGLRFPQSAVIDADMIGTVRLPDYPSVLKVVTPFVAHKTEMDAVKVCGRIDDRIMRDFIDGAEAKLGQRVEKVAAEERVDIPEGGEALLSVVNDPAFGPVIVFGEGGRLTELRRCVKRWLPGTKAEEIAEILRGLPLARLWFDGFRGRPPLADLQSLSVILENFGLAVAEFVRLRPDLHLNDFELNPVALTGCGAVALDLLFEAACAPVRADEPEIVRPNLARLAGSLKNAKAVAVAGPSTTDKSSLGRVLYDRLCRSFKGEAWAINPKGGIIDGREVFKSAADLPYAPDVLVLALSARFTAPTLRQAHERFGSELGSVLMLASGFDETAAGKEAGADLKRAVAEAGSTPVLGPNTMAMYSQTGSDGDVQIDFLPEGRVTIGSFKDPSRNNTALILQSGARFASFLDSMPSIGFRWSIMVGNAYQTDVADGIAMAAEDEGTRVIAVYVEGLHELAGRRMAEAVRRCRRQGKIVVIQKGGRTSGGASAARSHTASMSGSDEIFRDIITQAGAVVVNSETEFRDLVKMASLCEEKRPKGDRVFVINGAGYEGVLASDELTRHHLTMPKPPKETAEVLAPYIGKIMDCTNNPADVGPATHDSAYGPAVSAALASGFYDGAVLAVMPHGNGMEGVLEPFEKSPELLGPSIVEICRRFEVPVAVSVNGGGRYEPFRRYLEEHSIPVFPDAERAAGAYGLFFEASRPVKF